LYNWLGTAAQARVRTQSDEQFFGHVRNSVSRAENKKARAEDVTAA
jgi:hypothetical protein